MKVLIVDEMHPSLVPMLKERDFEVFYEPSFKLEDVIAYHSDIEGLVIRSKFKINKDFLDQLPNLKFIARAGAGLDLIDLPACAEREIAVFSANEANKVAVAEHVIGMLLSLLHKIHLGNAQVKNNIWDREGNRGQELSAKTVAIIGLGNNGRATAERLSAFGCQVMAYDIHQYGFQTHLIHEASLQEVFDRADIVSLHIPLTDLTKGWVNAEFFSQFKKPIILANIARGEIVNLKDLADALENGQVAGACLDVLENEKINKLSPEQRATFDRIIKNENVILSPHVAGWSTESYEKINQVLVDKIDRFMYS